MKGNDSRFEVDEVEVTFKYHRRRHSVNVHSHSCLADIQH